jgi:DNA-binding NtrC family response regulator
LREVERRHIQAVFEEEKGNKVRTAKALGISRRALYRLIDKYDLEDQRTARATGAE